MQTNYVFAKGDVDSSFVKNTKDKDNIKVASLNTFNELAINIDYGGSENSLEYDFERVINGNKGESRNKTPCAEFI